MVCVGPLRSELYQGFGHAPQRCQQCNSVGHNRRNCAGTIPIADGGLYIPNETRYIY